MLNPIVRSLFHSPYHMQAMEQPDVVGQVGCKGEGAYLLLYLKLDGQTVKEAAFETYGCPPAIACGSWVCRWLEGRTLETAGKLTAEDLRKLLGGLPEGKEQCADLAVGALKDALSRADR